MAGGAGIGQRWVQVDHSSKWSLEIERVGRGGEGEENWPDRASWSSVLTSHLL